MPPVLAFPNLCSFFVETAKALNDIRAYFGEKVAFFYAWLGYVTLALLLPAVVGLALQVYLFVEGFTWCSTSIDWFQTSVAAFVVSFLFLFPKVVKPVLSPPPPC